LQKQANLRMTPQRKVILEELRKVNTHPSADELYEMVRKRLPRISLGTVLEPGCSLKRFDGNPSEHCHIRCVHCDRIADAPLEPDLKVDLKRVNSTDFVIIGHRLEFIGVCPECSDRSNPGAIQYPPND
jgi:Fur family ferric uptake transcriptional regulator